MWVGSGQALGSASARAGDELARVERRGTDGERMAAVYKCIKVRFVRTLRAESNIARTAFSFAEVLM